jgi:hypothetical protein
MNRFPFADMNYRSFHIRIIAPLLLISAAFAQESQISGVVQDSSGGRVPDAVVSTVQEETGTRREARSDDTISRYLTARLD